MLDLVKIALRITSTAYDTELTELIKAAQQDLGITDIAVIDINDALTARAIITYCKMHFGDPENYDRFKASYDEQKAQMSMSSQYTNWGE